MKKYFFFVFAVLLSSFLSAQDTITFDHLFTSADNDSFVMRVPSSGTVVVDYDNIGEPDNFIIIRDGRIAIETGFVGDKRMVWSGDHAMAGYAFTQSGRPTEHLSVADIKPCYSYYKPGVDTIGLGTIVCSVTEGWYMIHVDKSSFTSSWYAYIRFIHDPSIEVGCHSARINGVEYHGDTIAFEKKVLCYKIRDTVITRGGSAVLTVSSTVILAGQEVAWHIDNGGDNWWRLDGEKAFSTEKTGSVTLFVSDTLVFTNGCDTLQQVVQVVDVFLPNVFSPNGDGLNDEWRPLLPDDVISEAGQFRYDVYDRWGEQVFSGEFPENWNGQMQGGRQCPNGVFIAKVQFGDKVIPIDVSLLR